MDHVTGEVRALLQEHQDRRKAVLDQRRRDVTFEVGDEVLLDLLTLHYLRATSCRPAGRDGPFQGSRQDRPKYVSARGSCGVARLQRRDVFNMERLRRYLHRPLALGGDADEPPPVVAQDGSLEHEVAAIPVSYTHLTLPTKA